MEELPGAKIAIVRQLEPCESQGHGVGLPEAPTPVQPLIWVTPTRLVASRFPRNSTAVVGGSA